MSAKDQPTKFGLTAQPDLASPPRDDSSSLNTSDLGRKIQASIVQGMYVSEKVLAFREKALKRQQEKQRKALEESYQQSHRFVKGQKSTKPLMRAGNRTDKAVVRGPLGPM